MPATWTDRGSGKKAENRILNVTVSFAKLKTYSYKPATSILQEYVRMKG